MELEELIRRTEAILYPPPPRSGRRGPKRPPVHVAGELRGIQRVVVFAGPGVIRAGAVEDLRRLAQRANVGVANSWGAKGLFPWDSPYHLGTVGLQERDFELCGFGQCDVLVATGIDPEETPRHRWAVGRVIEVDPSALSGLTWAPRPEPIERPPLYERLAAIVMPQYTSDRDPPPPGRRIADLKTRLGPGERVAADAATLAGFWVARAFPTTGLGSVVVPARRLPGFAAAASLVAARRGDRVIGVTTGPIDEATAAVLQMADEAGIAVELEVWGEGGIAVDWSCTEELIGIAGRIVAWGGVAFPG